MELPELHTDPVINVPTLRDPQQTFLMHDQLQEVSRRSNLFPKLVEQLESIANLTLDMPAAYGNPEEWYRGQCWTAIILAQAILAEARKEAEIEKEAKP